MADRNKSTPEPSKEDALGPCTEVASLDPEDAGKGPVAVILAGDDASSPDTRSTAAATRSN